jgi:hypothetical protein
MRQETPFIISISPVLNLIFGRGYNIPHSEWRGIGRILYGILLDSVLIKAGQTEYIKAMQSFPFLPHWPRIQSLSHLFSWSLSETGRGILLIPLILKCFGRSA